MSHLKNKNVLNFRLFIYIKNVEKLTDIFQYTHFRKYLAAYQGATALVAPSFSRTELCAMLGLPKTRSYFADVLRGKKVSPRMVQKFIEVLELNRKEAKYFESMVKLDQAKSDAVRKDAMEELLKINPHPQMLLNSDAYEYYAKWYHSALFAILDVMDVSDDLSSVAKRIFPKVTIGKLNESIALLSRLGLIRKNDDGFWKPTKDSISSGPYNNDELIREYQLQCFELSKEALLTPSKNPHVMNTLVFSLSKNAYKKLEAELQAFKAKAHQIVAEDQEKADGVYHMNIHLFSNLDAEAKP